MGNVATTVEKQIQILEDRGMRIEDKGKCREILLDIGYYRLGFYWNYFERTDVKNHQFKENTKFDDAIKLYYLDADLRHLLLKYLHRIEVHFRTQIVYYVSNACKSSTWFIDPKTVNKKCIDYFDEKYNDAFIQSNITLKRHHTKYLNDKYAPAWKTLEYIPFNGVLKIYNGLQNENLKIQISNIYKIRKVAMFESFMAAIVYVRNMCSHSGVIFDLKQPKSISKIPGFNLDSYNSLWASILAIKFILKQISSNRHEELCNSIKEIFEQYRDDEIIRDVIENKIGYTFFSKN